MVDFGYSTTNPSFSSSLLDAIYRSIDQDTSDYAKDAMRKNDGGFRSEEEIANFQRACIIDKWMEKKSATEKSDSQVKKSRKDRRVYSSLSFSDSSSGGFFSSAVPLPKPARITEVRKGFSSYRGDEPKKEEKHSGGFMKTKSRALKMYSDLKKAKQPISPGRKLTGFLNSFLKPKKMKTPVDSPSLKSANTSTCSSASSFSRSCLSKTPSSGGGKSKSSNGEKRSVRFSPVSVIVDDNCHYIKQTSNLDNSENNTIRSVIKEELMANMIEKNRRVEEVARDMLRKYHRKNQVGCEFDYMFDHLRNPLIKNKVFEQELMEDDAASCSSSDLFELDNLSAIGMEELPVYETTRWDSRTIADAFIS